MLIILTIRPCTILQQRRSIVSADQYVSANEQIEGEEVAINQRTQSLRFCSSDEWEELPQPNFPDQILLYHDESLLQFNSQIRPSQNRTVVSTYAIILLTGFIYNCYFQIDESAKIYVRKVELLNAVTNVAHHFQPVLYGIREPYETLLENLVMFNGICEIGVRFNDTNFSGEGLVKMWVRKYDRNTNDVSFLTNSERMQSIYTEAAKYLSSEIRKLHITNPGALLGKQNIFFTTTMIITAFNDSTKKYFRHLFPKIKRKTFLKYLKLVIKLRDVEVVVQYHLVKQLEVLVNKDLTETRRYMEGVKNVKIRTFYSNYTTWSDAQNNSFIINETDFSQVHNIPHQQQKYRNLAMLLWLNYHKKNNSNNYEMWDMTLLSEFSEQFPTVSMTSQSCTLVSLMNACYERSEQVLQETHAIRSREIGIIRKIDYFWFKIDQVWPGLMTHIFGVSQKI